MAGRLFLQQFTIMFCFHTEPPSGFLDTLTQHLLLVYTGKTRLARNLLQV